MTAANPENLVGHPPPEDPRQEHQSPGVMMLALASAGLASACCLGPAMLGLLGLCGLGSSVIPALESYRPLLIAIAIATLGMGFWKAYGRSSTASTCCEIGSDARSFSTRSRMILWMTAILAVGLLAYPMILSSLNRRSATEGVAGVLRGDAVVLDITGMTCEACTAHVKHALSTEPSVESASVSVEDGQARVTLRPGGSTARELSARIEQHTPYKAMPHQAHGKEPSR